MRFKMALCQVVCLVIAMILHSVTAQLDALSIEALMDHKFEKFEQKLMEKLQAQNREVINKQAVSFKSLESFINDVIEGQLELQKQMSNIMNENSREQVKLIEKLDAHATNVQQMTESINHLRNDTNGLLAGQLKNQNQLSSMTIDVQRLETHTDQEEAKLNEIHTLLRDTRVQNDQVIAKIDSHAANQIAESAKSLRNINDDIQTGQLLLRKEFSSVKNDLHSRVSDNEFQKLQNSTNAMYKEVIEKLADHATNAQKIAESIKNLGNITNNLLAGQSENRKQLVNAKTDLKHLISAVCPPSCATLNVKITGTYCIRPAGTVEPFLARCDFEDNYELGGGWTVFQHRYDGSVNFYRNWMAYRDGFGDVNAEHWLGLEKLNAMTKSGKHELLIILEDFEGNTAYAHYKEFEISSEGEKYKLTVGNYSGTARDSLEWHNGMKFSTFDQDNDSDKYRNCAEKLRGGWWFSHCYTSHLNGVYLKKGEHITEGVDGVMWTYWKRSRCSLKFTKMMLRRRSG